MAEQKMVEVEIKNLTYGGGAMGRLEDGRAVFVPFALPGERVRARLTQEKRGYARAELLEVLKPSAERIQPRCPHFGVCGGCHYQHMPYEAQLAAKQAILREQLERIGDIKDPPVRPVTPSEACWNYRNHVQFHIDGAGRMGFERTESNQVVAVKECHLPDPLLNGIWPQFDFEAVPGLERVGLRMGVDDVMLVLEGNDPVPPEFTVEMSLSAVYRGPDDEKVMAGDAALEMEVKDRRFQVSAGSFFQVNNGQAARMVDHLLNHLPLTPQTRLLEVYCGVGLFSSFLAEKVGDLAGIELAESACEDFATNLDAFEHISLFMGAAEEVLPGLDYRPDVVLVDPPRAGMARPALEAVIKLNPRTIGYVSCDPATLARDARLLIQAGYRMEEIAPFDLFPQTYHIESISLFGRD